MVTLITQTSYIHPAPGKSYKKINRPFILSLLSPSESCSHISLHLAIKSVCNKPKNGVLDTVPSIELAFWYLMN